MEFDRVNFEEFKDVVKKRTAAIIGKQRANFLQNLHRGEDFNRFLKQFGVVQKCWHENYMGYHFAIIQFEEDASAKNLVHQGTIVLCNVDFIVRPYNSVNKLYATIRHMKLEHHSMHPFHHSYNGSSINDKLFSLPEFSNENILTYLNADCLREIFLQMDDIYDFCTITNVCARFKEVGEKVVVTSLLKRGMIDFSELKPFGTVSIMDIEKFVSRLGFAVVSVRLCEQHFTKMTDVVNPILLLLQKHCPNVKSLTIYKHENFAPLQKQTVDEVRPLLSKLNYVKINYRQRSHTPANNFIFFLSACNNVHTLIVNITSAEAVLPEINFAKLKVFHLDSYQEGYRQFLSQNEQIEELDILWRTDLVHLLSNICPNLPKLFLRRIRHDDDLRHLKSLKQTNVTLQWEDLHSDIEVIFGMENISRLEIKINQTFEVEIIYELAQKLPNLKALELLFQSRNNIMSNEKIKNLLRIATKLEEFTMSLPLLQINELRENDCSDILSIVKERSDKQKLNIIFESRTHLDQEHGMKTVFKCVDPQWLMITNRSAYKSHRGVPVQEDV